MCLKMMDCITVQVGNMESEEIHHLELKIQRIAIQSFILGMIGGIMATVVFGFIIACYNNS